MRNNTHLFFSISGAVSFDSILLVRCSANSGWIDRKMKQFPEAKNVADIFLDPPILLI